MCPTDVSYLQDARSVWCWMYRSRGCVCDGWGHGFSFQALKTFGLKNPSDSTGIGFQRRKTAPKFLSCPNTGGISTYISGLHLALWGREGPASSNLLWAMLSWVTDVHYKNMSDGYAPKPEDTKTAKKLHQGSETGISGLCKRPLSKSVSSSFLTCNIWVVVGRGTGQIIPPSPRLLHEASPCT